MELSKIPPDDFFSTTALSTFGLCRYTGLLSRHDLKFFVTSFRYVYWVGTTAVSASAGFSLIGATNGLGCSIGSSSTTSTLGSGLGSGTGSGFGRATATGF